MPVFAVPGQITNSLSRGSNKLIATGATILTDTSDILTRIGITPLQGIYDQSSVTGPEATLLSLLKERPYETAELALVTTQPIDELQQTLTILEIEGLLHQDATGTWHAG